MERYWNIDGDMDTRPELAAVRESFREGGDQPPREGGYGALYHDV